MQPEILIQIFSYYNDIQLKKKKNTLLAMSQLASSILFFVFIFFFQFFKIRKILKREIQKIKIKSRSLAYKNCKTC
jgi:hypothetical protein